MCLQTLVRSETKNKTKGAEESDIFTLSTHTRVHHRFLVCGTVMLDLDLLTLDSLPDQ